MTSEVYSNTYPRMLYREGSTFKSGEHELDYRVVADAEEESAALNEGWRVHLVPVVDVRSTTKSEAPARPSSAVANNADPRVALRAEYCAGLGKEPFRGWSEDELRRRIDEHNAARR